MKGSIGFHSRQFDFIPMIVFCSADAVRVSCSPIPRSLLQWAIKSLSAGLYLTVVTVSSLPHKLLNVVIGVDRSGSHRWTAASDDAVTNCDSDQWWSIEWNAFANEFRDDGRRYTFSGPCGDSASLSSWLDLKLLLFALGFLSSSSSLSVSYTHLTLPTTPYV